MKTFLLVVILGASLSAQDWRKYADDNEDGGGMQRQMLTNEGIVELAKAGFSEAFILDLVLYKRTKFDISVDGLTFLAKKGLSERLIRAIVANAEKPEAGGTTPPAMPVGMSILPYFAYTSGYLPTPAQVQPERWYATAMVPKTAEVKDPKKRKGPAAGQQH